MIDLLLVVAIDEGFNCGDGCIHGALAEQCRQGAGQPAGDAPRAEQATALRRRQPAFDQAQMFGFGVAVTPGEGLQPLIAAPSGNGCDAAVDAYRAGLARVVRTQFAREPGRRRLRRRGRFETAGPRLQPGPDAQEAAIGPLKQWQRARKLRQACQPAPAGQASPHGDEGGGAVQPRAVGALHVEAREQGGSVGRESGAGGRVGTDVDEAQRAVLPTLRQPLHVRDFSPTQRTSAVVKHGQRGWLFWRVQGGSSGRSARAGGEGRRPPAQGVTRH